MAQTFARFPRSTETAPGDRRIEAIAQAIRQGLTLRLQARSAQPIILRPTHLSHDPLGWSVFGPPLTFPVQQADWGDINLSRAPLT